MKFLYIFFILISILMELHARSPETLTSTKVITIRTSPNYVWQYVRDLSLWPQWAVHHVTTSEPGEDGFYNMVGPEGLSRVKMKDDAAFGILDHEFVDPAGVMWLVYARVVAAEDGSHLSMIFSKPDVITKEDFEHGMRLLDEELLQLKHNLERKPAFTIAMIKEAHYKVKSGADFPTYAFELKEMGIVQYETFVTDGHTTYRDIGFRVITSDPRFAPQQISGVSQKDVFVHELQQHQAGNSDFPTFIKQCAGLGIEKWIVDLDRMTCTYYDLQGETILVEEIKQVSPK